MLTRFRLTSFSGSVGFAVFGSRLVVGVKPMADMQANVARGFSLGKSKG